MNCENVSGLSDVIFGAFGGGEKEKDAWGKLALNSPKRPFLKCDLATAKFQKNPNPDMWINLVSSLSSRSTRVSLKLISDFPL